MSLRHYWTPVWRERLYLAAILALAAVLRFWGLGFGLPSRDARPDESDIIVRALTFGAGDFNPHFFNYPTLWMYLVFGAYVLYTLARMLIGPYALSDFLLECRILPYSTYLIPRALSAIAGVLTVWIVYRIAARLFDRPTARVAAFLLAVAHLHVRDSHFAVTDIAMVCMIMAATWLILRCAEKPTLGSWLLAGAAVGLATSIKYNALFLAAPLLVVAGLRFRSRAASAEHPPTWRGLLVCGGAVLFFFLLGTPYALLDGKTFISDLATESGRVYADPAQPLVRAWRIHLGTSLWYGLGWPVWFAAFAGLIWTVRRLKRTAWVFLAFPVVYAVVAGLGYKAPYRYALPLVPFLCISAAVMMSELHRWIRALAGGKAAGLIVLLATLAAAGPSIACVVHSNRLLCRADSRNEAAQWIEGHLPAHASIYQRPDSYGAIPLHEDLDTLEKIRSDKKTPKSQRRLLDVEIPYLRRYHVPTYRLWNYDAEAQQFTFEGQPRDGLADYVLIHTHPVQWKRAPLPDTLLNHHYQLIHTIEAYDARQAKANVYSDGTYMPYAKFHGTRCPGPNVRIYARKSSTEESKQP